MQLAADTTYSDQRIEAAKTAVLTAAAELLAATKLSRPGTITEICIVTDGQRGKTVCIERDRFAK